MKTTLGRPNVEFEVVVKLTDFSNVHIQWTEIKPLHIESLVGYIDCGMWVGISCKNKVTKPYFQNAINDCLSQIDTSIWQQILKYSNLELHHVEQWSGLPARVKLDVLRACAAVVFT